MMTTYSSINNLPILQVLDKINIGYSIHYGQVNLWMEGKVTDGRKANVNENYVNDFSHDRPSGPPYAFVKKLLKLSDSETFSRFEKHFNLNESPTGKGEKKNRSSMTYSRKNLYQ